MMRALSGLACVVCVGCTTNLGSHGQEGPFDREVVELCSDTTSAVGVHTTWGGRIALEIMGPDCPGPSCEGSDVYAPRSWATVRAAGRELLLDGCAPLSVAGADLLRVTFTSGDAEPEQYEIGLVGDCLVGSPCPLVDVGPPPPPSDSGPTDATTDATTDAGA